MNCASSRALIPNPDIKSTRQAVLHIEPSPIMLDLGFHLVPGSCPCPCPCLAPLPSNTSSLQIVKPSDASSGNHLCAEFGQLCTEPQVSVQDVFEQVARFSTGPSSKFGVPAMIFLYRVEVFGSSKGRHALTIASKSPRSSIY